jgi:uncharacterized protein YfaS (alpha-2-macroglobulin family)
MNQTQCRPKAPVRTVDRARGAMAAVVAVAVVVLGYQAVRVMAASKSPADIRKAAEKAQAAGNFKDAFDGFSRLALAPQDDAEKVSEDLTNAVACLPQLARDDEIDDFVEKVIAAHAENWRLLETAAQTYQDINHQGFIVAGRFYRGGRHGNDGKLVNAFERDRVRALQLMRDAAGKAANEPNKEEVATLYFRFADVLLDRRFVDGAWRLAYLTDLTRLPDYEEGYFYGYYGGGNGRGAPVDEKGEPVYHQLPKSWEESRTDGQRWRWCLLQAAELSPKVAAQARFVMAGFLHEQFDVQTMLQSGYSPFMGRFGPAEAADSVPVGDNDTRKDESGPYAVSTLKEDETIARLANGIKRFKLPDEFNFIRIFQELGDGPNTASVAENALDELARLFEDRRQYDRSAEYWRKAIDKYGPGQNNYRKDALEQIIGNWAQFDVIPTQPAGAEPSVPLRFRNGSRIGFEAHELDVSKLLDDVKTYIKTRPNQLDWQKMQIENIGYRLVELNEKQYLGKSVAKWDLDVTPAEKHFDKRVTVKTPLKTAGAYLLTATIQGGNTTSIVVWVADTALLKKTLDSGSYYYVADANSGAPVAKANLAFFGYEQKWLGDGNKFQINAREFAEFTDADGQLKLKTKQEDAGYQWIVTATTPDGRLAYLGFTGIWGGQAADYDYQYNQTKVFTITDRPVYRPAQTMHFKIWVGQTRYDQLGKSPFADRAFTVRITDPKGEKVQEKSYTADAFGGFDGELSLTKDATLGVYGIGIVNNNNIQQVGGETFRVEEYKKPEFEVKIDAPAEAVMLGEKISATVKCNYYFGAPVTEAKVKYKVLRSSYDAQWYPPGRWDWFYEPGYWWFGCDYNWWPGWYQWGCSRPVPSWYRGGRGVAPEVVLENEASIGADGTLKIEFDTALAKLVHGDEDHKYEITAEVTDASRRTITGTGSVSVARRPFKVYAWVDRGYYFSGDEITAEFSAQTLDNKPVRGKGELKLYKVSYDAAQADRKPRETEVRKWEVDTDDQGMARQPIKAAEPGQYRLSYTVTDPKGHSIEGGYVFLVRQPGFTGKDFRFNDVEIVPDKKEYAPGDTVKLQINTNREDSTVLLFVRPSNGIYLPPRILHPDGKSTIEEVGVIQKDMPNFFVEAVTISNGKLYQDSHEIVVPPESRVVNVDVTPSASKFKPGEKAKIKFKLTDAAGNPVIGSAVVSVYDKAVEYISGGTNVPEIRSFFWKWRRAHYPNTESSLGRASGPQGRSSEPQMQYLGSFGSLGEQTVAGEADAAGFGGGVALSMETQAAAAPMMTPNEYGLRKATQMRGRELAVDGLKLAAAKGADKLDEVEKLGDEPQTVAPSVRSNFADTALWAASISADERGEAEVELTMPENLTTWTAKVWTMAPGTRVGQGEAQVVTYKDLLVRLQAPRFFTQKDEVVLSANVHNNLKTAKDVKVLLDIPGGYLSPTEGAGAGALEQHVNIPAGGEKRVDWRVKVINPGAALVRMSALTDEESDAMEMSFPVYIHGMLKTDSFSGAMRPGDKTASLSFDVPQDRLINDSRVEVRYSPSVAGAMVDALPYLVDYPYGCTEQTLNRFLPTVITQKVLLDMKLDLKEIGKKRTNLNAQEIGDDKQRAQDWKRNNPPNPGTPTRNPVFDVEEVNRMTKEGVERLTNMQNADGGWGWFSGSGEFSWPHTTALVVHGLQIAKENDVALVPGVLEKGVAWLRNYQKQQVDLLQRYPAQVVPYKEKADNLDAMVYMVLADAAGENPDMREFLYRDRTNLAVYSKAMYGLAMAKQGHKDKLDMILQNISQYLVKDNQDQTAYLKLPEDNYWWCWYGSDVEADAYYLKLLSKTDPKGETAPLLAKYLINNRKNASYWNSTRDTAIAVEAFADYIRGSGEDKPDMTVSISLDGKKVKEARIDASNLFSFDNKLLVVGDAVTAGQHKLEFTKDGTGPLYFNAYVTNFTLEDPIRRTGLEIRVDRKYYKLAKVDASVKVSGSRGEALDQKVEKYDRKLLKDGDMLDSGDLVEVELEIDSKNDYEYILFEDMKAAGFEPVEVQSGYNGNDLNAYMELRDERVCFFARTLARGKHSVAYRLRAEIPGAFSALPTRASAMYAPELKANSDEFKVRIEDVPSVGQ